MQTELLPLGIDYRDSRPCHPQTSGKVERFHQTMKPFLAKQEPAETISELQSQVDRFRATTTRRGRTGRSDAARRSSRSEPEIEPGRGDR